ncbi:MAG TPA: DUF4142 domain-containing protein [Pedobacter sp.]|nr:DUF4142 domain-containing protein [Pedobacter sp.]
MKNLINCVVVILFAGTATAQSTTQNQPLSLSAEQFINQAALCGMKEVATGKIAKQKAQDKKVKDFGAMMVEDHEKANTELAALAKSKSITLPKHSEIMSSSLSSNNGSTTGSNPAGNINGSSANAGINGSTTNTTGNTTSGATTNIKSGTNANTGIENTTNRSGNNGAISTGTISDTSGTTTSTANRNTSNASGATNNTGSRSTTNAAGMGNTATSGNTAQNKQGNAQASATGGSTYMAKGNDSLKMVTPRDVSSAIQQLEGLSGSQFDTAYMQMMVTDHKNAIALFERGATSSDPEIKAYALRHLPTLRSHEKHVQSLSTGIGSSRQQSTHEDSKKGSQ